MKIKVKVKVDRALMELLDKMASRWATTCAEAFLALWEADELVVVDGVVRLIKPTAPDGRIAW